MLYIKYFRNACEYYSFRASFVVKNTLVIFAQYCTKKKYKKTQKKCLIIID